MRLSRQPNWLAHLRMAAIRKVLKRGRAHGNVVDAAAGVAGAWLAAAAWTPPGRRGRAMPRSSRANPRTQPIPKPNPTRTIRRLKSSSPAAKAWHNPTAMTLKLNGFWSTAVVVLLAAGLAAQTPAKPAQSQSQPPNFRVQIDAVTMDVIVKDAQGRFVPDLKKAEFEI